MNNDPSPRFTTPAGGIEMVAVVGFVPGAAGADLAFHICCGAPAGMLAMFALALFAVSTRTRDAVGVAP